MIKNVHRPCAVCGGQKTEALHRQKFDLPESHPLASGYTVVACEGCGFVFADTAIDQSAYDLFYANPAKYERTSTGFGQSPSDARRLNDVAEAISRQATSGNARILDLGCANGGLLAALRKQGFSNLVGVDPSKACAAAVTATYGIEAVAASLYALPDLGLFDIITLSHVLERLEDLPGAVCNFARLLRPGGMVYIEVPDPSRYTECLIAPFQDFNPEHINHFSHLSVRRLMAKAGLVPFMEGTKTLESAKHVPYPALYGFYGAGNPVTEPGRDEDLVSQIRLYIEKSQQMLQNMDQKIAEATGTCLDQQTASKDAAGGGSRTGSRA